MFIGILSIYPPTGHSTQRKTSRTNQHQINKTETNKKIRLWMPHVIYFDIANSVLLYTIWAFNVAIYIDAFVFVQWMNYKRVCTLHSRRRLPLPFQKKKKSGWTDCVIKPFDMGHFVLVVLAYCCCDSIIIRSHLHDWKMLLYLVLYQFHCRHQPPFLLCLFNVAAGLTLPTQYKFSNDKRMRNIVLLLLS